MFDIHYSSTKSKTFRQFPLEFRQARLTLLKDLKVSLLLFWIYRTQVKIEFVRIIRRITRCLLAGIWKM